MLELEKGPWNEGMEAQDEMEDTPFTSPEGSIINGLVSESSNVSNEEEDKEQNSESEDEDYVPAPAVGGDQDEEYVSGEDVEESKVRVGKKRNAKGARNKKKAKKKRKGKDQDSESDDDEEDTDFTIEDRDEDDDREEEEALDPEEIKAREEEEKERTDKLWDAFLCDVKQSENKKKEMKLSGFKTPQEKTVTKFYDFAGERVKVEEKVRIEEPKPGPSSSKDNNNSSTVETILEEGDKKPRRYRFSFLSGNPSDIGLAISKGMTAKEGLSNVRNALHARSKKLGTLEKSKIDWEVYKKDQNLQDELTLHNRSRNGYIEKQEFLQRADFRQFELEKTARSRRRRPL